MRSCNVHFALGILVALLLGGIVIAILMALLFRHSSLKTRRNWYKNAAIRRAGIPAAGNTVKIDAAGLTLNAQHIAWSDITIEAVGFRYIPDNEGPTTMAVERLLLTSPQAHTQFIPFS